MKRLLAMTMIMLMFMLTFGGMAYGSYYPWGRGQANVNTATQEELAWFLGRGSVDNAEQVAENIITYRESSGPLTSTDELLNVEGIDEDTYDLVRLWLKTSGPTDHDPEKTVRPHTDPFFGFGIENYRD
ncbi:MAG: Helix-hairpin-helix motif protein [Deltaproteobacteria bacterium ADurb.BinA179]|jgi:hypothetical protein|nr:helix-hairpin-helix domain-containing protein [Deltaproteobacteria bacterium]MDI9541785.1 helix-hairpin-helix domain-containing protein [Pseudomonadota bacterium]OPZ29029.1 MAG: Helix-hairpin-helix motif protein [Deltaproteobacteria bacterium ADurb.BinA179]HNU75337.1 helix-hairpin-helix domain-containing protein [Deltaproteobacteria bacterium]HOD70218.1 helix-hairpin-helix domain-containing protein [Deltaproteobacteria bacterium]